MSDLYLELRARLLHILRSGDLASCELVVAGRLAILPPSPFHRVLDLAFTNPVEQVAEFFDDFFRQQPVGSIMAAYAEMNGFEFNADRWYCVPFVYREYGGHKDYDYEWLADWQSEEGESLILTGMESLQEVYKSELEEGNSDASDVAALLVVIRFQDLIRRSAPFMRELRFPLLSAAHDYDFIDEVRP